MPNKQMSREDTMSGLRVSKAKIPSELRESMIKQFGAVAEPVEVTWHNPAVAQAALQVGGSWCLDINYFAAQNQGLDVAKASQVPRWREATVFTPLERDVLEYAEA